MNFFWVELSLITQLYIVPTKVCLCHDDKDEKGDRKKALIASTQNHRKKKINPQFACTIRQMHDVTTMLNGIVLQV